MPIQSEALILQEHPEYREASKDRINAIFEGAAAVDPSEPLEIGLNDYPHLRAKLDDFRPFNIGNMLGVLGVINQVAQLNRDAELWEGLEDRYQNDPEFRENFERHLAIAKAFREQRS